MKKISIVCVLVALASTFFSCEKTQDTSFNNKIKLKFQSNNTELKGEINFETIYNGILESGGVEIPFSNSIINIEELEFYGYDKIRLMSFNGEYLLLIQYLEGNNNYAPNAELCDRKFTVYEKHGKISGFKCDGTGKDCHIVVAEGQVTIYLCS